MTAKSVKTMFKKYWYLLTIPVFYLVYKKISSVNEDNSDKLIIKDVSGATLTDVDADRIATVLYEAMGGYGTKEDVIYEELKGMSKPNFNKVYNAFGVRYYNPVIGTESDWALGDKRNLWYWLNAELNLSELSQLKKLAPEIF